ncbi:MAG: GntR family transcriptional regulator [Caldicoprobacterales bacterium]|jgi:GntR family transcriptional regulator|nr:GntR family transcriptional regulator [Clostridiales bacterium]
MLDFSGLVLSNRDPIYVQIASYVKKKILAGHVSNGDPLPSRREIAIMLGINPNTAQKAFRLMEEEGYVVTVGNMGSIISINDTILSRIKTELTENMVREFIQSAKDSNLSFKEVFDFISDMWDDA